MANIVLRLSTGSAGTTNSNPNQSLGGKMATNPEAVITTSNTSLNNLFDDISKAENYAGTTDYRCVYIHNDTAVVGEIFAEGELLISNTPYAAVQIGVGTKMTDAPTIVDELTAPSGVSFSAPTAASPLPLMGGTNVLNPGEWIPVWIKRTANNIAGSGTVTDSIGLSLRGIE